MSKLWIIHRQPRRRDALAHLSGLAAPELLCGGPTDPQFEDAPPPALLLLGLDDDFELELDFLHRHRNTLAHTRRLFLTAPKDVEEVRRLFAAAPGEILEEVPSDRRLRALILSAVSHRNAESLAGRRGRARISERFERWFGELEIPGLLRALDPNLGNLPLLVRGVSGSGRSLLAHYVELFRGAPANTPLESGPVLRVDGAELRELGEISQRSRERAEAGLPAFRTVWIDQVDAAPPSVQRALAEWIRFEARPDGGGDAALRWVATAGPGAWPDALEASLEHAFAPLSIAIPPLVDDADALARFAASVAADWQASIGGPPRRLGVGLFPALEAHAWTGDRAAVEAVLRATFAATSSDPVLALNELSPSAPGGMTSGFGSELDLDLDSDSDTGGLGASDEPPDTPIARASLDAASEAAPVEREPVEDTSFLDETFRDFGEGSAESSTPPVSATPASESVEDFERAFLEGLPEPGPAAEEAGATERTAERDLDPSAQFSEESFEIARTGRAAEPPRGEETPRNEAWRRLARSLSHEIRNPLVSIRTFTELLPEHFEDASFRERFTELVGRDVAHIDEVVSRLADAAAPDKLEASPVDVSALLERLLDTRSERIAEGRLLVLRELEREHPVAWADPHALEVALAGLLDRALAALPERGDLFVATRRIDRGASDGTDYTENTDNASNDSIHAPRLRILLRHHNPELTGASGGLEEVSPAMNILEYVLAETVVEACGGSMTIDSTDRQETLILVDLKTPA